MGTLATLTEIAKFLLENSDLIEDIYDLYKKGASKDSIKQLLKDFKVKLSDEVMKEELGL